jgi:acetate kinase
MIIVTVNSGSTSIKLSAYEVGGDSVPKCIARSRPSAANEGKEALARLIEQLRPHAVAHRVVHGGTRFTLPVRVDETVLRALQQVSELAPLHNPPALGWMGVAQRLCEPVVQQIAVFDTAFFAGLPRVASEYALAPHIGIDHGVRRYGFHGLAHEAMLRGWQGLHPRLPEGGRVITLQLGGGCSIAAISEGRPLDTSMGFSPLEGLVMATRSGDIDPAVVPYLQRRLSMPGDEVVDLLNREGGLAGLSGRSANVSDLMADSDPRSRFALDLYCYRARKYVGAYLAVLGGCDGIVFGGGVGENVPDIRARILAGLQWAGIEIDADANESCRGHQARLTQPQSRTAAYVIPVDEEGMLVAAAQTVLDQ